jgi:hypothetical protein
VPNEKLAADGAVAADRARERFLNFALQFFILIFSFFIRLQACRL